MEQVRPLPVRESLQPGESLASLIRRHAVAMGYENVHRLLQELPLPRGSLVLNSQASEALLEPLGGLLRQCREKLLGATFHRFAPELRLVRPEAPPSSLCDSKSILRFWTTAESPVCPLCLRKDPTYERLLWSFRPLPVCGEHSCFLRAACHFCGRAFRPERLDVGHCRCGAEVAPTPVISIPTTVQSLTESISAWVLDGKLPLPGLTVAAGFWWVERLATAVCRTPSWQKMQRECWSMPVEVSEESLSWLAAADLFQDWPRRFEAFLEAFQTVTRHRHAATGVSRGFGRLLREAQYLEGWGYSALADALRSYLLARYTRGHLSSKVGLFQDPQHRKMVTDRPWISPTESARQLGLRRGAVTELVQRRILIGQISAAEIGGRSVGLVSRDSVVALREDLKSALTVPEACHRLGLARSQVFELIREDLLPRCVRTNQGWKIPMASVDGLRGRLDPLPFETVSLPDAIDLGEATRRFGHRGLTLVRLLNAIADGHVPAFRVVDSSDFRGVRVRVPDLKPLLPTKQRTRPSDPRYTLTTLAAELIPGRPLKNIVLRKWIKAGLLTAHQTGRLWRIPLDAVDRFRSTYCLADEACQILGIQRRTLARWEAEGRIVVAYGRRISAGAGASVYRRAELDSLRTARSTPGSASLPPPLS